jgi:hypothetical protein
MKKQKCPVWTERATRKIMKNDRMQRWWWPDEVAREILKTAPYGGQDGKPVLLLSAARNEVEWGQIVVSGNEGNLNNVELKWSELKGSGSSINSENIKMFLVHYVYLPYHQKEYPDGLTPLKPFSVKKGENQPVWVEIYVPKGTPAGVYKGTVEVCADGELIAEVVLEIKVRNFELSDVPPMRTAFGISPECIFKWHNVERYTPESQKYMADYYEFFLRHRISTYSLHEPDLLPFSVHDERAEKTFGDPRITTILLPYSDDYEELKKTVETAEKKGFLDKCYFYVLDEPVKESQFEVLREVRRMLDRVRPGLRLMVPYHCNPDFAPEESTIDYLKDYIEPICPQSWRVDIEEEYEKIKAYQASGKEVWWLVCCENESPFCNFLVDMDAIDHRMLFWQQKYYGIQGLLYWSATYWTQTENPWIDMATWKCYSDMTYGDGSVLYPGTPMGFDEPCASIRLKLIHKGINDYEYLCLLEQKKGKDYVREILSGVVTNMSTFERFAHRLDAVRDRIAEELEAE